MKTDEAGVDVPYLRLRGWWLHTAGFTIGRTLKLEISEGRLLIEASEQGTRGRLTLGTPAGSDRDRNEYWPGDDQQ